MENRKTRNYKEIMETDMSSESGNLSPYFTIICDNITGSGLIEEIYSLQDLSCPDSSYIAYLLVVMYLSMLALNAIAIGQELTPQFMVRFWEDKQLSDDDRQFSHLMAQADCDIVPGCNTGALAIFAVLIRSCYELVSVELDTNWDVVENVRHGLYRIILEDSENGDVSNGCRQEYSVQV